MQQGVVDAEAIAILDSRVCILAQCSHAGIAAAGEEHAANNGATPNNSTPASNAETSLSKILTSTHKNKRPKAGSL